MTPGKPPRVERMPYEGGLQLGDWSGTLPELETSVDGLAAFGYLRVRVSLDAPVPDLNRRVRQLLPNVVVVDAVLPELDLDRAAPLAASVAPADRFRAFHQRSAPARARGGDDAAVHRAVCVRGDGLT